MRLELLQCLWHKRESTVRLQCADEWLQENFDLSGKEKATTKELGRVRKELEKANSAYVKLQKKAGITVDEPEDDGLSVEQQLEICRQELQMVKDEHRRRMLEVIEKERQGKDEGGDATGSTELEAELDALKESTAAKVSELEMELVAQKEEIERLTVQASEAVSSEESAQAQTSLVEAQVKALKEELDRG